MCNQDTIAARFAGLVSPPSDGRAAYVATTIAVGNLDAVGRQLTANRIDHDRQNDAIQVAAKDCFGLVLEFVAAP